MASSGFLIKDKTPDEKIKGILIHDTGKNEDVNQVAQFAAECKALLQFASYHWIGFDS